MPKLKVTHAPHLEILTPHERRKLAVVAEISLPTIETYLKGNRVRELSELRISRALTQMGFAHVIQAVRP